MALEPQTSIAAVQLTVLKLVYSLFWFKKRSALVITEHLYNNSV
jgi:hypothetical protein